jgi:hypothetical protein
MQSLFLKFLGGIKVSEQVISQYVKSSFLKNKFFSFKVNGALKSCDKIKKYLLSKNYLSKRDSKLNLITSDGVSNQVENSYLVYKGYDKDGSIKPIKKYTIINGEIIEHSNVIKCDIIILDLYEKSIYLHSYFKDSNRITGYLIKEEIKSEKDKNLIFSNEKININIKNINKFDAINVIDDFLSNYII